MSKLKKKTSTELLYENLDPLSPDMEFIRKELKYLRNAIDKQNTSLSRIASLLQTLTKEEVVLSKHEHRIMFPIQTLSELDDLEKEIEEDSAKYHETFREMIFARGGLEKNLRCIICPQVALNYNWDGTSGKKGFKHFKNLNLALYNAIQPEISTPDDFKKAIRNGLKRIKNLHFKKISLQKKQDLKVIVDESFIF